MATSPDMILTVLQNGVTAINNLTNRIDPNPVGAWQQYVPSVGAAVGSFGSASGVGRFKQVGSIVCIQVTITITTNGTGASAVTCSLPVPPVAGVNYCICGRENAVTGKMLEGITSGGILVIFNYDNSYPGGNGFNLGLSGIYEAA
jgi:hypothetical protein